MKNKELLPCPFCGGEATMTTGIFNKNIRSIMCRNCHTKTKIFDTNEEAITAWNNRTNTIKMFVEKLKEKVSLFSAIGTQEFADGAAEALEWYDKKVEEALKEMAGVRDE